MDIKEINILIDKEMEFAREVNIQMVMGMLQIKKILNDHSVETTPGDNELITPMCKIVSVVNKEKECPSIDIYEINHLGEKEIISSVEYNPEDNLIATYTYQENEDDFINKTVYKSN